MRKDELWTIVNSTYIKTVKPTGYDILINGTDRYLNFNSINGTSGYGFRDNAGIMEWKNSSGSWTTFGTGGGSSTFIGLTDVPASYASQALKVVRVNAGETALEFFTLGAGTGDVVGPGSSTDNAIARFDLATGKLIQNSQGQRDARLF